MERNIFEDHALFSQYLSIGGMRASATGTKPSIYITCIKLKKAVREMNVTDMKEITGKEVNSVELDYKKDNLTEKIELMEDYEILAALAILIDIGRIECVSFIFHLKIN